MTADAVRALKQAFLDEYGSFSDKRIKNVDRGSAFMVDDRADGGVASDGSVYGWFCEVFVNVIDQDRVLVTLRGQIPKGVAVDAWMEKYDVMIGRPFFHDELKFDVGRADVAKLTQLATALRLIVILRT